MTIIEITAKVGEDRQINLPPDCPIGTHRFVIYVEDDQQKFSHELPLGNPPLKRKDGVLVLNLPDVHNLWLDTDAILTEIREERVRQSMGSLE